MKAFRRTEYAIINRSFWPDAQVLGEALMVFAETLARKGPVSVITMSSDRGFDAEMAQSGRGRGVRFQAAKAFTDSSSHLLMRALESLYFMLWTFVCLLATRPAKVYVSTNPPVTVPFIVYAYSRLFGAEYFYHLQDIHPEAARTIVKVNPFVFRMMRYLDCVAVRNATALITLSSDMEEQIRRRSGTSVPMHLVDNPAFDLDAPAPADRSGDLVFCGNAGRLQRMPVLLESIQAYLDSGGTLRFAFAGAGLFAADIARLAERYSHVRHHGVLPADKAADLVADHRWALLPIEDEVTRFAFPSKSSSYVLSGSRVLAICGLDTSVARWVLDHEVGEVCSPEKSEIVAAFRRIEAAGRDLQPLGGVVFERLAERLTIPYFVRRLVEIVGPVGRLG